MDMDSYPVLVNNKIFLIKATKEVVNQLKFDDEFLIQYLIGLIKDGNGPKVSPHDINGFLNIERVHLQDSPENAQSNSEEELCITSQAGLKYSHSSTDPIAPCEAPCVSEDENSNKTPCEIWCSRGRTSEYDLSATQLLLELRVSDKYVRKFDDKKTIKLNIWNEIAEEMQKQGYQVNGEKCRQKFLNLTKKYITFVREVGKTGNAKIDPPPFYDLLHMILGQKDKVNLNDVRDSLSTSQATSSTTIISKESASSCTTEAKMDFDIDVPSTSKLNSKTTTNKKQNRPEGVTKLDILNKIVECSDKCVAAQTEGIGKVMDAIREQNELLRQQIKQREKLIDVFEKIANPKKRRSRSSDSD